MKPVLVGPMPALAFALALLGCERGGAARGGAQPSDRVVARAGESAVYASEVRREAAAQNAVGVGETLAESSPLFRRVLDEVIDRKLLAEEAERRGLDRGADAQRRLAAARERALADMVVETAVAGATTDQAVRALYADTQRLARPREEVRARQIVVATAAEVQAVAGQLAAGAPFERVAQERSTDAATRFNGGDLGYFALDLMPEPYVLALRGATAGQVAGPFRAEAGWVVLRVEDRRPQAPKRFEELRPQLVRFLTYDRVRLLLDELRRKAEIKVLVEPAPSPGPGRPGAPPVTPPPAPPA